jgi:hypothetical protein
MSPRRDPYLDQLERHAAETRTLFSNAGRHERERKVVRAYLRTSGIAFTEKEIQPGSDEPVDIAFRTARFQIMDIVGDRQRGRTWKERHQRYSEAKSITDVMEPWTSSEAMPFSEAARMIAGSLNRKARHYGRDNSSALDGLVYVDLGGRHLWPLDAPLDDQGAAMLREQGWRSVSMLFLPYAAVLSVRADAPEFLKERAGFILREWPGPGGWFDP